MNESNNNNMHHFSIFRRKDRQLRNLSKSIGNMNGSKDSQMMRSASSINSLR